MQAFEKQTLIKAFRAAIKFPRGHILSVAALTLCLISWTSSSPSSQAPDTGRTTTIALPAIDSTEQKPTAERLTPTVNAPAATAAPRQPIDTPKVAKIAPQAQLTRRAFTVHSGDSLASLFKRAGLSSRELYTLTHSNTDARHLTRIMPGHKIVFFTDHSGDLQKLVHISDSLHRMVFAREGESYNSRAIDRKPRIKIAYKEATIDSSLFLAGQSAGLHANQIMQLANIFGWDIDFALDIRKGDHFNVLYEEQYLEGKKLGNGDILAAEFINQGERFRAVRYTDANNVSHYYTPDGKSMRKAFLRAPVDFRRISANFNPKRLHPIFKTVRPHRGTDYAADTGTPIWASGDGRVVASSYSRPNGNYVFIQHGNNIETKYLHMSKRLVKKGDIVKQKQVIGLVGQTGYATGPHLHYEFLLNGVHRNPRTIVAKLPKADAIAKEEMPRFNAQTSPLIAQIQQRYHARQLALNGASHEL